jgi:hypothetical protein
LPQRTLFNIAVESAIILLNNAVISRFDAIAALLKKKTTWEYHGNTTNTIQDSNSNKKNKN